MLEILLNVCINSDLKAYNNFTLSLSKVKNYKNISELKHFYKWLYNK